MVTLSSVEAKYYALHHVINELFWLKILLWFWSEQTYDCFMITVQLLRSLIIHYKMTEQSTEFGINYIKGNLDFDVIKVSYVKSAEQLINIMTHGIIG